jgi:hypothetical protein
MKRPTVLFGADRPQDKSNIADLFLYHFCIEFERVLEMKIEVGIRVNRKEKAIQNPKEE